MATTIDLGLVVGSDGITFTPEIGTVTTLSAGSNAGASVQAIASQGRAVFSFSIPRGADGADGYDGTDGADGITYTPEIGTVTTLSAGSNATASVQTIASQGRAVFSFGLPRGADGSGGGGGGGGTAYTPEIGTVTTLSAGSNASASVQAIASQGRAVFSFSIPKGADGSNGTTYTPEIGTVTTLSAGSNATASVQAIASQGRAVFSFGLPRGADGSAGSGGGSSGATLLISFSPRLCGKAYTVTGGNSETYTGTVPASLVDAQQVQTLNSSYTVSCTAAGGATVSTTVAVGSSAGTYPCELSCHIYGFHIDSSKSSPSEAVTYLQDAVDMTPAAMDFAGGIFNYGDWANAFFMPRPCMLKYDGTVDYYLDPDDYAKKADGVTASDAADDSYGGNVMMEWGRDGKKIWYKIVPDSGDDTSASVYIADHQADNNFHAWSFINNQGTLVPHFYTPAYVGWIDGNGRLRSISGKAVSRAKTVQEEITAAELNNPSTDKLWYTEVYCDRILINLLLTLISKSLDSQTSFGNGVTTGGESGLAATGTLNDKGLFFGYSSSVTTNAVKVFGMENWWGNQYRRIAGLIDASGTEKYKLTRGTLDGSTASDYNRDGTGYLTGPSYPSTAGDYIRKQKFDANHFTPTTISGSASTYYCDKLTLNSSAAVYAMFGGSILSGSTVCGMWTTYISGTGHAYSDIGAAISCKPLAASA